MYRRMLVPLDGSELAEVVFPYAKELAGRLGIDVILLHISATALRDYVPMNRAYVEHAADTIRREARRVQRKAGLVPEEKAIEVRGELVVGYPPDEILRYAEENAVDLILMASHGRSGSKRWALGSVAGKILHAANIPVLLVRTGIPEQIPYDEWPKRTIIVPLDGSELAESVLPHAEALAKQGGREMVNVILMRVCEVPVMPVYYTPELAEIPLNWGQYAQQETARCRQMATEYLAGIEPRFRDSGINVKSEVLVGTATDEIIAYANKTPYNLIVMATHGRSGLSRLVYGSVAVNILVGVNSPLLLVKPTAKQ
jgi:nucleotide-binding universal stress UspA family protein